MAIPEWVFVWRGYERDLQTLLIYGVGIALYTALVFAFYQNISRRNAFSFRHREGWRGAVLRFLQTTLVFPLMTFLYFGVLGVSLFVLAKSQTPYQIVLLSMSVVIGVRVTAFLSESASVDLAKMLPLALLGVLVVDPSYVSFATTRDRLVQVPSLLPLLERCFLLFILLEAVLRIGYWVVRRATYRDEAPTTR